MCRRASSSSHAAGALLTWSGLGVKLVRAGVELVRVGVEVEIALGLAVTLTLTRGVELLRVGVEVGAIPNSNPTQGGVLTIRSQASSPSTLVTWLGLG